MLYTAKETISQTKRKSTEWEKIFAYYMINNGLSNIIYKSYIIYMIYIIHTNQHQKNKQLD